MRQAYTRSMFSVMLVVATLSACSESTGPNGGDWWEGTWVAVRANDTALPYRSDRGIVVRDLVISLRKDTTQSSTFYSAGTITTLNGQVLDNTSTRTVRVTPGADSVAIYAGPTSTIGQLQLTLRRKADTLSIPSYSGAEFKLVRSR